MDYWKRMHRGAVSLGMCPVCGLAEECAHPRAEVRMRKPAGIRSLEVTSAYQTAGYLEERMGSVVDAMLTRLSVCGECRHPRDRHTNDGPCGGCVGGDTDTSQRCMAFAWSVTLGEVVTVFNAMKSAVRHEQRIDADLGLDVQKVQVVGSPIATALEARGVTLEAFKRMGQEERANLLLEVQRGVVEAEVVERE